MNEQHKIDELLQTMFDKGYIVQKDDGLYSPRDEPPPPDEDKELRDFWTFLCKKADEKRANQ